MSLPTIAVPTFEVKIPSTGKAAKFRPFLVKEEKLLLIAAQTKEELEVINTTIQIIENCCISKDVKIDELPFFDIDYLFIMLRSKSIGENVEINLTCNRLVDGQKCGQVFPAEVDLTKTKIKKNKILESKIELTNQIGVKMKYPKYSEMKRIMGDENIVDKKFDLICASIEFVYDKDNVYTTKDYAPEDFSRFIDSLTNAQLAKLEEWIYNFPSFEIDIKQKCPKCGHNHNIKTGDFTSFFT